jgi:phosphoribosylanthranilate isomerase
VERAAAVSREDLRRDLADRRSPRRRGRRRRGRLQLRARVAAAARPRRRSGGLAAIQLHGQLEEDARGFDPPDRCRQLAGLPVIRAVRMGSDGLATARRWLAAAAAAGRSPDMLIVDAGAAPGTPPGRLGGTGHLVDWEALAREPPLGVPAALAGGLSPANVAAAIRATGAAAVDTASGVEAAPGRKDPALMRAFAAAARAALGLTD